MESEAVDPRAALDEVRRARGRLSERVGSPWWFHAGLGLLVAQQVLVNGASGGLWTALSFGVLVVGAAVLVAFDRRATGVTVAWPRGPRGNTLMAARAMVALVSIWGAALIGSAGLAVLIAVVACASTVLLGFAYDAGVRRDIAEAGERGGAG
ncbi:hypothetical protein [Streptomyces sp. CC219B]|uniref:hypothetical protein n=1 Tax=Streptomyces sp. CC219B TaxID=3044574 RepID=UPI0024A873F1|nr:hypothetical protein [Streptomyces sp. CC219B]